MSGALYSEPRARFRKTSDGSLFAADFHSVFAMMIISLNLSAEPIKTGRFSRPVSYAFTLKQAQNALHDMTVVQKNGKTRITIKCSIDERSYKRFISDFFKARLLHCPLERTEKTPKESTLIQPTAKGVAVLSRYVQNNGIETPVLRKLILSEFNSMRLVMVDRSPETDAIVRPLSVVVLIFQKFLGSSPNVYTDTAQSDPIPRNTLESVYSFVDFSQMSQAEVFGSQCDDSPYHHRYYTHPDSDAVSQYYASSRGIRHFSNVIVHPDGTVDVPSKHRKNKNVTDYCFTGKAAVQWLIDCCDFVRVEEAIYMANLFLLYKMIIRLDSPNDGHTTTIRTSRSAFYTATEYGRKLAWDNGGNPQFSLSNRKLSLADVLSDPGLKLAFQSFLKQHHSDENLQFYNEMREIMIKVERIARTDSSSSRKFVEKNCLSHAYFLFYRYIAACAPCELNLSHRLKSQVAAVLTTNEKAKSEPQKLQHVINLYQQASEEIFTLMSRDSMPKFLRSPLFHQAMNAFSQKPLADPK